MNPAVAYLVLACGTGKDHRGTSWSVQAIQKYTSIAWIHGKPAVEELFDKGFIKLVKSGTRPRYELLEWDEVEATRRAKAPRMDSYASIVYDKIARGCQPKGKTEKLTAEHLVQVGRLWVCEGKCVAEPPADDTPLSEHYIWLPQTLVTGTSAGEASPLERVRRAEMYSLYGYSLISTTLINWSERMACSALSFTRNLSAAAWASRASMWSGHSRPAIAAPGHIPLRSLIGKSRMTDYSFGGA